MAEASYGQITESGLEELEDRIGTVIDEPQPYHEEATIDTIRHWANGIGTDNPLYTDPDYASDGPYGEIVAPPTFLYSASKIVSGYVGGLPGVHAMYAGTDWDFEEPIRRGTRTSTESHLHKLEEYDTDFAGEAIRQIYRTKFYDQYDTLLATADSWCFRTERDSASKDKKKYETGDDAMEVADWNKDDIERFAEHYRNEEPRGVETRYFEDVDEGEELDTLLKGPMTVTDVIAYDQGWGGLYIHAHRQKFAMMDAHPALMIENQHGAPEPPECVHWNQPFAKRVGVPAPYDYGPERVSWLGHVCHHWMGDDGFLESLYGEVRRHNLVGDVTWCKGEVIGKRRDGDKHLVDIDLVAHNHRDQLSAQGEATIRLPSRKSGQ
jgi:acyl dehydratase